MRAHLNRNFVWINQRSFESSPGGLGIAWTSLTPVKRSDEGGTGTESTLVYGMYKLQVENRAQKLLPGCCWEWEMVNLSRCRLDLDADTDIVGLLMRLFSNWVACPLGGGWNTEGWIVYTCEVDCVSEADPPPCFPPHACWISRLILQASPSSRAGPGLRPTLAWVYML